MFVLIHHPEDAQPGDGATFLSCDVAEAARIGLEAAAGKNLEIFSASIGRQLLERGLIDEINLHIVPVLLGDDHLRCQKTGQRGGRLPIDSRPTRVGRR